MKVQDIVSFSKESFFNGAVQTEWFYDPQKVVTVAESYVFHGPKYYGVSSEDVKAGEHRLMDTASFARIIANKLYSENPGNSFVMTIAGYGTGKSHLAVCLGALFSGEHPLSDAVAANISAVDSEIGTQISALNRQKNLIIVLNGMNNFNLDAEILRCARLSLSQHGFSDDVLRKLTKSYDIAKHFVSRNFEIYKSQFESAAQEHGLTITGTALKNHLTSHIENDSNVLIIINEVYKEVNGDSIAWDRGLSAGDVLFTLQEEFCGPGKPFNKILLLFDEFGRYIEYTAANPAVAGEAALQQIFEATQSASGNIIFVGFIQSELEAYLSRIEKTSNIIRYIDRYRTASENLFLSSNFETILANNLKKSEPNFSRVVNGANNRYDNFHKKLKSSLGRWDRSSSKKSVWTDDGLYRTVILNGCYPLHPITVWLLSSSHEWMQQRSTLAFAAEMFESVAREDTGTGFLPYVYPYQIIDSGIFGEMLNSEEKGLVSSQYCMLYRDILVKVGDKLTDLEKTVLKSVLVVNMGRMAFFDKKDAIRAIQLCSNCKEDEVEHALKSLEEMHGVVSFDSHTNTYDLIAEANGFNEFKRIFARYRLGVKTSISDIDETLSNLLSLDTPVETSFAQTHHISSTEWMFRKSLMSSTEITENYLRIEMRRVSESCDGESARGLLIYAYCSENSAAEVARLSKLYRELNLDSYAIIILFLDDSEKEILSALTVKKALLKFSAADRERFSKHISDQQRAQNNKISRKFTNCVTKRSMIGATGLVSYSARINALCTQCFERLFVKAVPFTFDGFENKSKTQANATLTTICCFLYNRLLMNQQGYNSLSAKDKNRVGSTMSLTAPYAWKVYDSNCQLVEPGNPIIAELVSDVIDTLEDGEQHPVYQLFYKFVQPPYGMNENSISLLISYFIAFHENRYIYYYGNDRLTAKHWSTDKGKLKIPELKKISIQKNANISRDLVSELCDRIMSNTDIRLCRQLKDELTKLVAQEGESDSNQYKVAQAHVFLEQGIRLAKAFDDQMAKANAQINALTKKFTIVGFVKIFDLIPTVGETIEEGLPFVYSADSKNDVLRLQAEAHRMLEQRYLAALGTISFQIEELSEYRKRYRRVSEILRANACAEYADATDKRIDEIEAMLRAKQRHERSLVDCERDLTLCGGVSKYQECLDVLAKLEGWQKFFADSELPKEISEPLVQRIDAAIAEANGKLETILNTYVSVIDDVESAETTADLRQLSVKISTLLQLQIDTDRQKAIVEIEADITSAGELVGNLPEALDGLYGYIQGREYEATGNRFWKVLKHEAETRVADFEREQRKWVQQFVVEAEQSYETMSAATCQNWLKKTATLPTYISAGVVERVGRLSTLVERQMHKSRVSGLIAAYDALSEGEKEEFKKLLSGR